VDYFSIEAVGATLAVAREAVRICCCLTGDRKGRPYESIRSFSEGKYLNYALCIMHYAFYVISIEYQFRYNPRLAALGSPLRGGTRKILHFEKNNASNCLLEALYCILEENLLIMEKITRKGAKT